MTINQLNNYQPGQNLSSLANNVDYNRLGDDKTSIEVDFAGSPADVTVHIGSQWEINGNLYDIDTADETFTMSDAGHNYITYNETTGFDSAATAGTWDAVKQGFYQADNVTRTLCWFIDQTDETYDRSLTLLNGNGEAIQIDDLTIDNVIINDTTQIAGDITLDEGFQQFTTDIKIYTGKLDANGQVTINTGLAKLENYMLISIAIYHDGLWHFLGLNDYLGNGSYVRFYPSTHGTPNLIRIDYLYWKLAGYPLSASKNYRLVLMKVFDA